MRCLVYLMVLAGVVSCGTSAAVPASSSSSERAGVETSAEALPSQPGARITEELGAVVQVGDFGFGLVPDADPGTRYAPTKELAEEFQQEGQRVVFSGVVEESPRGVRLWGTPLRLTAIRRAED